MILAEVTSARSSPGDGGGLVHDTCAECDTSASITSDLHKYQVACTCKPNSVQYACAEEPGPQAPRKTGDTPPALPPRPQIANNTGTIGRRNQTSAVNNSAAITAATGNTNNNAWCSTRRKYGWWCIGCGALAAALGGLLATAHILLRTYTTSTYHLETVPAAVPAAMLVLTGICIMSLARRRNRYSYMIKVVGACCLVCALTCVLVTITTTVIHMNKLQTLRYCEYTQRTRTCTCYSMPLEVQAINDDDGVRCVFEGVHDCSVVHGVLYWCLRGVFALSVTAVLVCIFSSMLAYQLLSHERKKMYWEQLELRCRSLYRPPNMTSTSTIQRNAQPTCTCCTQCHQNQPVWDMNMEHRFWAPGRIGNLYSPNPGTVKKMSPWSWLPWSRNASQAQRCRMGPAPHPSSGDSAYGFCETDTPGVNQYSGTAYTTGYQTQTATTYHLQSAGYQQAGGYRDSGCEYEAEPTAAATGTVWGPPPPYSPHGRSRHHIHQDPATTTLLHQHHHTRTHVTHIPHACNRNSSYLAHAMPPRQPDAAAEYEARFTRKVGVSYNCHTVSLNNIHDDCIRIHHDTAIHAHTNDKDVNIAVPFNRHKQGTENLAFQTETRSTLHLECGQQQQQQQQQRSAGRAADSELYFADVSNCCNISVKASCCKSNTSALVGTIENHPESTSGESDTGTLKHRQRAQQTLTSKRRLKNHTDSPTNRPGRSADKTHNEKLVEALNYQTSPFKSDIRSSNMRIDVAKRQNTRNFTPSKSYHPRDPSNESCASNVSGISLNFFNRLHPQSPISPGTEESIVSESDQDLHDSDICQSRIGYSFSEGRVTEWQSGSDKHNTD